MKTIKLICATILLCALAICTHAQQRELSLSFTTLFPDTIFTTQQAIAYISVRNVDTGVYNGSYTFRYSINGGAPQIPNSFSGIQHDSEFVTVQPSDSVQDTLTIHPTSPFFNTGPSVVVIWPIRLLGDSIAFLDSLRFEIEIIDTLETGIHEPELGRMYYNNGRLFYRNESEVRLNHVRIIDIRGATIANIAVAGDQYIGVPDLPCGMYIAEAILSNNRRLAFKFIPSLH